MRENNYVSNNQIRGLMVSTIVGIGILTLPHQLSLLLENDGWIAIILGGLLMIPSIIIINRLFQLYPDRDIFEIGRMTLGRWIFNILLIPVMLYYISLMAFLARSLGEITKAFLLETTPIEVLIVSFILASSYIARCEIQIIGRATYHIYPIILGFVILLSIVSSPNIDFTNMLPMFQSNINKLPEGIMISFFSYFGFEILILSIPFAEEKNKTLQSSLIGIGIVIVMYLIIFVIVLSQYGLHNLQRQLFPTLDVIKEIDFPGFFIENLDGLVMAIWVLIVFGTMAPTYYSAGKVLSNIFNTKDHSLFILPLLPIIYIISLIPQSLLETFERLGKFINYSGLISIVMVPVIIYFVGYFRLRRHAK